MIQAPSCDIYVNEAFNEVEREIQKERLEKERLEKERLEKEDVAVVPRRAEKCTDQLYSLEGLRFVCPL